MAIASDCTTLPVRPRTPLLPLIDAHRVVCAVYNEGNYTKVGEYSQITGNISWIESELPLVCYFSHVLAVWLTLFGTEMVAWLDGDSARGPAAASAAERVPAVADGGAGDLGHCCCALRAKPRRAHGALPVPQDADRQGVEPRALPDHRARGHDRLHRTGHPRDAQGLATALLNALRAHCARAAVVVR